MGNFFHSKKFLVLLVILWVVLLAAALLLMLPENGLSARFNRQYPVAAQAAQPSGYGPYGYGVLMGTEFWSKNSKDHQPFTQLYEDGQLLGPADALHAVIGTRGGGRFSLWNDGFLYFSSSDNSDPRTNGRQYTLVLPNYTLINWSLVILLTSTLIFGFFMIREKQSKIVSDRNSPMTKPRHKTLKLFLFLFPIAYFLVFLFTKIAASSTYLAVIGEDALVENVQFVAYFISAIISLTVTLRFFRHRLFVLGISFTILTLILTFIAMEEISWGQRFFGFENSEFMKINNAQHESNIHNLHMFQSKLHKAYILLGLYGTLAWIIKIIPAMRRRQLVRFSVPDWFMSPYFFFVMFIYGFLEFLSPFAMRVLHNDGFRIGAFVIWRDQEPAELLLALGFLVFVWVNSLRARHLCSGQEDWDF